jgi:hypothetical protein
VEGRPHQRQDRLQPYLGLKFRFVAICKLLSNRSHHFKN